MSARPGGECGGYRRSESAGITPLKFQPATTIVPALRNMQFSSLRVDARSSAIKAAVRVAGTLVPGVFVVAACGAVTGLDEPIAKDERLRTGESIYAATCVGCHGGPDGSGGNSAAGTHGPTGHTWHHPDGQLRDFVRRGKPSPGTVPMPAFGDSLDDNEVDAVLAYIKIWWTEEQRASQADTSARYKQDTGQ